MDLHTLMLLVVACLAVNLSPGPSVMLVTSISAARGFRAGAFAMLGMTAGAFVHVLLAASGVAALLATAPVAFAVVRYLGAAYLIYLGIDLMRPYRQSAPANSCRPGVDGWHYFRRGLLVDALNPKIALFFLAFIPQFLASVASPGFLVSVALGSVFLVTGAIVNGSIAWLVASGADRTRGRFSQLVRRWIPGSVLLYLGLRLLWHEH
ncbi:MAG: LysE family translocator [Gammaproteobacteria bacterium]|nr:LysE family translocator [Gammaproteobacteria bacterium]MDH3448936.1 LysE family translocator [Gammaproteobacteria bacterium]